MKTDSLSTPLTRPYPLAQRSPSWAITFMLAGWILTSLLTSTLAAQSTKDSTKPLEATSPATGSLSDVNNSAPDDNPNATPALSETPEDVIPFATLNSQSPSGSADNPFLIESPQNLYDLATVVNQARMFASSDAALPYNTAHYRLANDIDLTDIPLIDGAAFNPIGSFDQANSCENNSCFSGTFDGNGQSIIGLTYNQTATPNTGLFGVISDATIINLTLSNPNITNHNTNNHASTGALVGTALKNSQMMNIAILGGTVTGRNNDVGGLAGKLSDRSSITASAASPTVMGLRFSTGGLVGQMSANSAVFFSAASGNVMGSNWAGGLVGAMWGNATIAASYASGNVSVSEYAVGALVGSASGNIIASYASGGIAKDVTGRAWNTGGLVGVTRTNTTFSVSYWGGGAELQTPTDYEGLYEEWNIDIDNDGTPDDPWDFGTTNDYPALKNLPISIDDQRSLSDNPPNLPEDTTNPPEDTP